MALIARAVLPWTARLMVAVSAVALVVHGSGGLGAAHADPGLEETIGGAADGATGVGPTSESAANTLDQVLTPVANSTDPGEGTVEAALDVGSNAAAPVTQTGTEPTDSTVMLVQETAEPIGQAVEATSQPASNLLRTTTEPVVESVHTIAAPVLASADPSITPLPLIDTLTTAATAAQPVEPRSQPNAIAHSAMAGPELTPGVLAAGHLPEYEAGAGPAAGYVSPEPRLWADVVVGPILQAQRELSAAARANSASFSTNKRGTSNGGISWIAPGLPSTTSPPHSYMQLAAALLSGLLALSLWQTCRRLTEYLQFSSLYYETLHPPR